MWPFGRRNSAVEPRAEPAPDREPSAWETLPPLTPTIPKPEPTFKIGDAVKEDLVSLEPIRFTSSMGHHVSEAGPGGLVHGLATVPTGPSVQRSAGDSELVLRPPRRPSPVRRFWTRLTGAEEVEAGTSEPEPLEEPTLEPPRRPVVPPAQATDGAAPSVVSTDAATHRDEAAGTVGGDEDTADTARYESNPAPPLALARMPVVDHPVQRSTLRMGPPEPEPPRPLAHTAGPANPASQDRVTPELPLPPVQRPTTAPEPGTELAPSRPDDSRDEPERAETAAEPEPVDGTVDLAADTPDEPTVRDIGPDPTGHRAAVDPAVDPTLPPSTHPPVSANDEVALPLQPRSVQRKVRAQAAPAADHNAEPHDEPLPLAAAAAAAEQRPVEPPPPEREAAPAEPVRDEPAPLVSAHDPGRAGAPLEARSTTRSGEPDAPDAGTGASLPLLSPPVPVLAHRPVQPSVQRTSAFGLDHHRPVPSPPVPNATASHQLSPAYGSPAYGGPAVGPPLSAPEPHPSRPRPAPAVGPSTVPDAGTAAVSAGIAQRMPDGSVVFAAPSYRPPARPPEGPPDSTPRPGDDPAPAVQRAEVPEPPPEPAAESAPGPSTEPMTATVSAAPVEPPGAPPPGGSGEAGSSDEAAELVKKIWPDIRWRLRNELRVERERKGQR